VPKESDVIAPSSPHWAVSNSLAPLVALEAVEEGGFFRRMWDSIRLFFKELFG